MPGEAELRLPSQLALLEGVIRRKQASLAIIDPLLASLDPSVNIHHDSSVRRALAPLAELAAACRCAVILLRHLSKAAGARALYRGLASIAFIAACRIAWLIGRDPKVPDQFVGGMIRLAELVDAKYCFVPAPAPQDRTIPEGEWYCHNPWCVVRECRRKGNLETYAGSERMDAYTVL